jgi:hypothetical protein
MRFSLSLSSISFARIASGRARSRQILLEGEALLDRAELHSKIDTRPDIDIGGKAALPRCKRREV